MKPDPKAIVSYCLSATKQAEWFVFIKRDVSWIIFQGIAELDVYICIRQIQLTSHKECQSDDIHPKGGDTSRTVAIERFII